MENDYIIGNGCCKMKKKTVQIKLYVVMKGRYVASDVEGLQSQLAVTYPVSHETPGS